MLKEGPERFQLPYRKIVTREQAINEATNWHRDNQRVVLASGAYDIPTVKHAEYLSAVANLGDKTIVRLSSDAHSASLKDPRGPIVPWNQRAMHLAHYPYVDLIIPKDGDEIELLNNLKPDVMVFSITTDTSVRAQIDRLYPYLEKLGTEIVVFGEDFRKIPYDEIEAASIAYKSSKFDPVHISGSNIKQKISRRAVEDFLASLPKESVPKKPLPARSN